MGVTVNGSKRWLSLGFMQFQPSEIAKIVTIIISASYLGQCIDKKNSYNGKSSKKILYFFYV